MSQNYAETIWQTGQSIVLLHQPTVMTVTLSSLLEELPYTFLSEPEVNWQIYGLLIFSPWTAMPPLLLPLNSTTPRKFHSITHQSENFDLRYSSSLVIKARLFENVSYLWKIAETDKGGATLPMSRLNLKTWLSFQRVWSSQLASHWGLLWTRENRCIPSFLSVPLRSLPHSRLPPNCR